MWGHLAFILPAPSSFSTISGGSLIGDLLCRSQSLPDVAKGEWDPLFSPSFLQSKHPHGGSSNPPSPWGLYYILPLSQLSIPAAPHICPVYNHIDTCWCEVLCCYDILYRSPFSPKLFYSVYEPYNENSLINNTLPTQLTCQNVTCDTQVYRKVPVVGGKEALLAFPGQTPSSASG